MKLQIGVRGHVTPMVPRGRGRTCMTEYPSRDSKSRNYNRQQQQANAYSLRVNGLPAVHCGRLSLFVAPILPKMCRRGMTTNQGRDGYERAIAYGYD